MIELLNINLKNLLFFFTPEHAVDRLVSVYGAAAYRDRSSVYIRGEDSSLYKGMSVD